MKGKSIIGLGLLLVSSWGFWGFRCPATKAFSPELHYFQGNAGDSDVHLSDFVRDRLNNFDTYPWFKLGYDDYHPDALAFDSIELIKDHLSFIVFGGSWCEDTRDLLPRFYKTMEKAGLASGKVVLIGVDHNKDSHDGRSKKYNIEKVPTFIVFYDGNEIGRVVEAAKLSIEDNILQICHAAGH